MNVPLFVVRARLIAVAASALVVLLGTPVLRADTPALCTVTDYKVAAPTVVAVLFADQGSTATPGAAAPRTQSLETIARHAARSLESLTAFKAARALATIEPQAPVDDGDEDVAAKRYARLLISEIRLYHEAAVAAGRREGDLTTRLGGEIARARVLYEQRVPKHVRQRANHFHDELVRTLADGDAALVDSATA